MIELTLRDRQVLEAVVTDYIESGEPVGSRTISRRYGLKVSSATIRNVMADLEEMGLLQQPHTSAGRVPTGQGLRIYLDSLIQFKELEKQQRALIRTTLRESDRDAQELLKSTSLILSRLCRQAGVVLRPKLSSTKLRRIEFVRLRSRRVMAILVSRTGMIHHGVLQLEEDIGQDELDKYGRYLKELLEDVPLGEVKQRVLDEMRKEKVLFDELYGKALEMTRRVFQSKMDDNDVYIEGQAHLLSNPEFSDVGRMRNLLEAFEDKSRIVRLLDMTLEESSGVRILFGSESEFGEWNELSLITSPYRKGNTMLGVLGVIGPVRMDYSRIVPVVEFTAALLGRLFEEPGEE